jgi:hypothetical protein
MRSAFADSNWAMMERFNNACSGSRRTFLVTVEQEEHAQV